MNARSIKIAVFSALVWMIGASSCLAQSGPNWSYSYVPTPAEWQFWWTHKMDYNGVSPCLLSGCTFSGPIITPASTTIGAGINIPPGVAPATPNNGDIWTTSSGIFVQINGSTIQLSSGGASIGVGGTNQLAYYTAPSTINGLATANNGVLVTSGAGAPSISSTLPSGISATNMNLTTPTLGVAAGTSVALGGCTIGANAFCTSGNIAIAGTETITSTSASALAVGANGATNPALQVDASTASSVTGLAIKSAATGAGVALTATDSGANTNLIENAKGTGIIQLGSVSTGGVQLAAAGGGVAINGAAIGTNALAVSGTTTLTSSNASALAVGLNGATNPALQVDDSTASSATGWAIKSKAAAAGASFTVLSSGTNENGTIDAKGSGTLTLNGTATGTVNIGGGGGGLTVTNSFTATGLVTYADIASAAIGAAADYLQGTNNLLIQSGNIYQAETTTTFGATTTFNFNTFINTAVTLTGNITTMTLSNVTAGKAGQIRFIQDGTGSRTTVWNSIFKFAGGTTPSLSTTPNNIDVLFYSCVSASLCYASLTQNMK